MKKSAAILLSFFLIFCACNNQQVEEETNLGVIHFDLKGNTDAIASFEKGLLLLHSFEYEDAAEAFITAQQLDRTLAMAYWGEAMTYNHTLWNEQNFEKGLAALNKLDSIPEQRVNKASALIEKDFMHAVGILYGSGSKTVRDKAYADFMSEMKDKYPGNHEVAAFYGLSLLGAVEVGRDEKMYGKCAGIVQSIIDENPRHPGALHYLIHSYDDPDHAQKALFAANKYSRVAPDAAHALHMPSHIYFAMGMWDDVVASNEASWDASVNRMKKKNLDNDARSYHALHWLMYGYLQQGRTDDALQIMNDMEEYTAEKASPNARSYKVGMVGTYLTETGNWLDDYGWTPVETEDLNIIFQSGNLFANGMRLYSNGQVTELDQVIRSMEKAIGEANNKVLLGSGKTCSGVGSEEQPPNQRDIDQSTIMLIELKALQSKLSGNPVETEAMLQAACELEAQTSYSYGPPTVVKPPHELYGEWLLENARGAEALEHFDKALLRNPRRLLCLQGKVKAFRLTGEESRANAIQNEIAEMLKNQSKPI